MGVERTGAAQQVRMQSLVYWALLGLVIERPSYAYELAQRFERTYESLVSLSSISHVYTALGALKDRGLVEEVAGTRSGRQPKPHYCASAQGVEAYRDWLVEQLEEERRRQRLSVVQLAALARHPGQALDVLDRYEQACLEEARGAPLSTPGGDAGALVGRLLGESDRLAVGAKLAWIQYTRRELKTPRGERR